MGEGASNRHPAEALTPPQLHAARCVIARVRAEVEADLAEAALFGSRARGEARPDSDVDLLLVFRWLPADREPFATQAERIAEQEARRSRIPVTVWCVSLVDLALGQRTPMLVDALEDAIPIWFRSEPLPSVPFTPADALHCVGALLRRVAEGSDELAESLAAGAGQAAARRIRDDLVRLCTAALLLQGITRPRRAAVLREFDRLLCPPSAVRALLRWAERSFGVDGKDEDAAVPAPPGGVLRAARIVESVRRQVEQRASDRSLRLHPPASGRHSPAWGEWSLLSRRVRTRPTRRTFSRIRR